MLLPSILCSVVTTPTSTNSQEADNDYFLPTDRTKPDGLRFDFPNQASGIMFSATSSAIGDRNKGRVCLGNMHIIYANPNY